MDEFYQDLSTLTLNVHATGVAVVGDSKASFDYLAKAEGHIGGSFVVLGGRIDNSGRISQVCSDRGLFLVSTNFGRKMMWAHLTLSFACAALDIDRLRSL